jgi:hypothetical protein
MDVLALLDAEHQRRPHMSYSDIANEAFRNALGDGRPPRTRENESAFQREVNNRLSEVNNRLTRLEQILAAAAAAAKAAGQGGAK